LGLLGADWLHQARLQNQSRLREQTEKILERRKVRHEDRRFDPTIAIPLITAAQDRTDDTLLELWAELLATSVDESTAHLVRRLYIEILKQLDPLDAKVLLEVFESHSANPVWSSAHTAISQESDPDADRLSERFGVSYDEVILSFERLSALGCVKMQWHDEGGRYLLATYLADGLRNALMPDRYPPQNEPKGRSPRNGP
jgi:Abortive infection alpha